MIAELEEIKKSLKNDPKDSGLLKRLGWLYLKSGYYRQAKEEYYLASIFNPHLISEIMIDYENILKENGSDLQARLSLISFCLSWGDIDSAVLELEELLDNFPNNSTAYNLLGRIYIKQERLDEALSLLLFALSSGIKDTQISEMLASVYLEKGLYLEAISFFEELPNNKNTMRTLAELYTRVGDFNRAAEKYHEMFKSDPEVATETIRKLEDLLLKSENNLRLREILVEVYGRCLQPDNAVKILREILSVYPDKLEETINQLKKILKNYPCHPDASLLLAEALTQKGNYSESIEEYARLAKSKPLMLDYAISGCKEILKKYPDQYLARQFLVNAFLEQDNFKEALIQMKAVLNFYKEGADWVIGKCRDILKKEPQARIVLGYAHLAKGDFSRAALEAESILSSDKISVPALLLLGEIYLSQGLSRKSVETFGRALELDPFNLEIHKKYAEARKKELLLESDSLKKRMMEDEWKISLHFDLAKIYLIINQREDALRELQSSLRDSKRAPFANLLMGNYYREEGRFDLAASVLKHGLETMTPDIADVGRKIKFALAQTLESQGSAKKAIKVLEEIYQEDLDFPGLREKIKFLKESSLASVQNRLLVMISAFFDDELMIGFWGRETRSAAKRQALSVSFSHNYNLSGFDYFIRGMHQYAQEEFTLAAQLDPNSAAGINNLGVTHLIGKRYDEALHLFNKAFELEPSSSVIACNLGLNYHKLNNLNEAQKWLEKSIAVNKDLSAALINLGDVCLRQNQAQKAIESYRKIPAWDILYDTAQKRLWGRII